MVFGVAIGIADAERMGATAKAQVANPIINSRFILRSSSIIIALIGNPTNPNKFRKLAAALLPSPRIHPPLSA
jgi:hypothetical protein